MTTIPGILYANAAKWPDRDALIATCRGRDTRLTFAGLRAAADCFAADLSCRGIRRGDAVLVFVPMSLELYVALLGIFRLGAVAVFLDPTSGLRHINDCCRRLPPSALISVWPLRWARWFVRGLRKIPLVLAPPKLLPQPVPVEFPGYPSPDDAALITFTSGSTGKPKSVVRTHRFLIAQHDVLKQSISLEPGSCDLTTLPVFVLANLASGITSILPDAKISHPGAVDVRRLSKQVRRLNPTRSCGSPAFFQRLTGDPSLLSGLRKIYVGGAPVFPALLQNLQNIVPDCQVVAVYGSSEAEPIAHIACSEIASADWQSMREGRGLLAGLPVPAIRLRIVSDQWGRVIAQSSSLLPRGIGEIIVTGDHVLKAYLHGEGDEETKTSIEGEVWHRTGDAGYLDVQGRLWLLGRCSARIQDAKGTLYPFAVECVAMSFSFVRRAAFVSVGGKRVLAVEGAAPISRGNLTALQSALLWAPVDEVRQVRRIPVDARHNAKVNYPVLLRLLNRV